MTLFNLITSEHAQPPHTVTLGFRETQVHSRELQISSILKHSFLYLKIRLARIL